MPANDSLAGLGDGCRVAREEGRWGEVGSV